MGRIFIIDDRDEIESVLSAALPSHSVRRVDRTDSVRVEDLEVGSSIFVLNVDIYQGFAAARRLKKDRALKAVPLLLVSRDHEPETFARHRRLPTRADAYALAPFDASEITATVQRLLSRANLATELTSRNEDWDTVEPTLPERDAELSATIAAFRRAQQTPAPTEAPPPPPTLVKPRAKPSPREFPVAAAQQTSPDIGTLQQGATEALESRLRQTRTERNQARKALELTSQERDELRSRVRDLELRLVEVETATNAEATNAQKWKSSAEFARAAREEAEAQTKRSATELEALQSRITEAEHRANTAETELRNTEHAHASARIELTRRADRIAALEEQLQSAREAGVEALEALEEADARAEALRSPGGTSPSAEGLAALEARVRTLHRALETFLDGSNSPE